MTDTILETLMSVKLAPNQIDSLFNTVNIDATLLAETGDQVSPPILAQALALLLFEDLLERVPNAKLYCESQVYQGQKITLDHGALRTVAMDMARLPSGRKAFDRILVPLGYVESGIYPLDKLGMCGFVYTHSDYPESLPQYFVSELYPENFSEAFQNTVARVIKESNDPLTTQNVEFLNKLKAKQWLTMDEAASLLPCLLQCFDVQHQPPRLSDYHALLEESAEMAWIATEGNAFNHATDRVDDIEKLEQQELDIGRPMKPAIEFGKNANIKQTAYLAALVERVFVDDQGVFLAPKLVPGSFFEFIERGTVLEESGREIMDLRFDSQNAQGIFKVTARP